MNINNYTKRGAYELDCYIDKNREIPAFTTKNVEFIEAVIRLDSNYSKEAKILPPEEKTNFLNKPSAPNKKYSGSAKYWFNEMKNNSNAKFRDCVLGAVLAIDRTNSTHLEASGKDGKGGRELITDIICDKCKTCNDLIAELNKPFNKDTTDHLLAKLTDGIPCNCKNGKSIKKGDRYNLSFASKFCACAARELGAKDQYSKYDNVVSEALPIYEQLFLKPNKKPAKNKYKITATDLTKISNQLEKRLTLYERYTKTIELIITENASVNTSLTKEEFDHIIWYAFKG